MTNAWQNDPDGLPNPHKTAEQLMDEQINDTLELLIAQRRELRRVKSIRVKTGLPSVDGQIVGIPYMEAKATEEAGKWHAEAMSYGPVALVEAICAGIQHSRPDEECSEDYRDMWRFTSGKMLDAARSISINYCLDVTEQEYDRIQQAIMSIVSIVVTA